MFDNSLNLIFFKAFILIEMEHPNNFIRESFELLELDFQEYVNNVNLKD